MRWSSDFAPILQGMTSVAVSEFGGQPTTKNIALQDKINGMVLNVNFKTN